MSDHFLEVVIERDYIHTSVVCRAVEGAECRMWCNNGCETHPTYGEDDEPVKEDLFDQGTCLRTPYLEMVAIEEAYVGPDNEPLRSGEIDLVWQGDWYGWQFSVSERLSVPPKEEK
jgi:hypothetical protein